MGERTKYESNIMWNSSDIYILHLCNRLCVQGMSFLERHASLAEKLCKPFEDQLEMYLSYKNYLYTDVFDDGAVQI